MTAAELWLALTAQGHDVDMAGCERLVGYRGDVWVSTNKGAYALDQTHIALDPSYYGDAFWLLRDGVVQEVERGLFARGWAQMRKRGEV